ncbi:hypothetical protein PFISCL1PPCAC_13482, partial [Pristionchus fissidentatus]
SDNIAIACSVSNTLDVASLVCLSITTNYVNRRKRLILNSSLKEKYQVIILIVSKIKEVFHITRVMLPCGVISFIMKFSSSMAAWIYALDIFQSKYMFTLTGGVYLTLDTLNCMICSTILILNHAGLRKLSMQMLRVKDSATVRQQMSPNEVREVYFDALKKEWN